MQEYLVITTFNARQLSDVVTRRLAEGYHLVGGMCIARDIDKETLFCQAMVKP